MWYDLGEMRSENSYSKIAIVIPTLVNFKGLAECLASIKSEVFYKLYLIDNWRNPRSVSQSWNEGVDRAIEDGCEYIAILNDDVILSEKAIDYLSHYLDFHKDCGLVTGFRVPMNKLDGETERVRVVRSDESDFACFMIRASTFKDVGRFDENFVPAYFEDNDYHYRCKLAGVQTASLEFVPFFHEGSVTQNWDGRPVCDPPQFRTNRAYYVEKWGGLPGAETFSVPYNNNDYTLSSWRK